MQFIAEYIWTDQKAYFRSKARTITMNIPDGKEPKNRLQLEQILKDPGLYNEWSYDGSSTGEADGNFSEIILKPVAVFMDPFRRAPNVLVLCDTYNPATNEPMPTTHRPWAKKLFNKDLNKHPWYGLEQEFFIMQPQKNMSSVGTVPLGFSRNEYEPKYKINPQGQYYCSVGSNNAFGRVITDEAYKLCLESGVNASGMNAEVAPGQWEIQVGPCEGIAAGDHLQIARYILHRVGEKHNVQINYQPKPVKGDWNGSGCHSNFSTKETREGSGGKSGLEFIYDAVKKLEKKHDQHMSGYGEGNIERMSGNHETSSFDKFTYGVANRGASIRIPQNTETNGKGYFEDRRPGANVNPYLVIGKIFETVCL